MTDGAEDAFANFLSSKRHRLRSISSATRGEHSLEDVQAEAWLMAADLQSKGLAIDLRQAEHQDLLLSHLYQHLVRYTELNVRKAVRLDHAPAGSEDGDAHPLMRTLSAQEEYDPIVALMLHEERMQSETREPSPHESLAGAYLHLLRLFDNRMKDVADHLLISVSYCYFRFAHAKLLTEKQRPLSPAISRRDAAFVPSTWRPFRIARTQSQLSLDFGLEPPLFG